MFQRDISWIMMTYICSWRCAGSWKIGLGFRSSRNDVAVTKSQRGTPLTPIFRGSSLDGASNVTAGGLSATSAWAATTREGCRRLDEHLWPMLDVVDRTRCATTRFVTLPVAKYNIILQTGNTECGAVLPLDLDCNIGSQHPGGGLGRQ